MEPWDGPACVAFTDGTLIGAVLDRNGLRPGRYWVTDDGLVVLASEVGVLDLDPATRRPQGPAAAGPDVPRRHRRTAGSSSDDEIKAELAAEHPYDEWLHAGLIHLDDLPEREHIVHTHASVTRRQQTFGYTEEELRILLAPMARTGAEPIGSMGTDTPIAVLSERPRLLFDYFTQLFAQVTNPPLDAIREELVTSLGTTHRPGAQPARRRRPATAARSCCPFPVIDNDELAKIVAHQRRRRPARASPPHVVAGLYRVDRRRRRRCARRLDEICAEVSEAIDGRRARSSCCPTATPTPTSRRSRRCCSPRRCTTT